MTRSEAKDDKGEPGALAELVGHDPTMADALNTLTKDLAPGEDALFRRFEPNQPQADPPTPPPEYDTDKMPIYSPPTAIPHRSPVKTFEMETVKVDPESDARRATTQRNLRKPGPPSDAPAPQAGGRDRKVRAIAVALFGVAVVLVWAIVGVLASKRAEPEQPDPVVTAVPVPVTAAKPPEPPAAHVATQPAAPPEPPAPIPSETAAPPESPATLAPTPPAAPAASPAPAAPAATASPRPRPAPASSPKKAASKPAPERTSGAEPPHPKLEF